MLLLSLLLHAGSVLQAAGPCAAAVGNLRQVWGTAKLSKRDSHV
jgi:hypothetical protein